LLNIEELYFEKLNVKLIPEEETDSAAIPERILIQSNLLRI
jgi:hypothetical protein